MNPSTTNVSFWSRELAEHRLTCDDVILNALAELFHTNDLRNWGDAAAAEHPKRWKGAHNFSRRLLDKLDTIRNSYKPGLITDPSMLCIIYR